MFFKTYAFYLFSFKSYEFIFHYFVVCIANLRLIILYIVLGSYVIPKTISL